MLKGRLLSLSKTRDSFLSSRGSAAIWLIAAICFAVVFLGIVTLLLWNKTSDGKPPTVPATISREVREPIKSFAVSNKRPEESEKPVQKPVAPSEDGFTEKPDPSAQEPLNADPSRIQDVTPDDPPGNGVLSQDLKKQAPSVLSENHKTPKAPPPPPTVKPPLVAENSKVTDKTLPSDVEKPSPASLPEVSVPTEKTPAPVSEKPVATKHESVGKAPKEMTVVVVVGNVRKGPSVKEKVLFTVARGDSLQVTDQKGNWYAVRLDDGRSGWAHRTLLHGPSGSLSKKAASSPKSGTKKFMINGIRTVVTDPNHAQIIFELNGYHPPEIMVIEGEVPRVVCDFFSARLAPGVKKNLSVKTGVVKRIRVGVHKGSKPKVRVVLDLNAGQNYAVEQFFFEKENYYALMVNSGEGTSKQ
jgi:SH3-like domain-containing protein